ARDTDWEVRALVRRDVTPQARRGRQLGDALNQLLGGQPQGCAGLAAVIAVIGKHLRFPVPQLPAVGVLRVDALNVFWDSKGCSREDPDDSCLHAVIPPS